MTDSWKTVEGKQRVGLDDGLSRYHTFNFLVLIVFFIIVLLLRYEAWDGGVINTWIKRDFDRFGFISWTGGCPIYLPGLLSSGMASRMEP